MATLTWESTHNGATGKYGFMRYLVVLPGTGPFEVLVKTKHGYDRIATASSLAVGKSLAEQHATEIRSKLEAL